MGADRKYTGTSCYDSSTIAPPKGLAAFIGTDDPLAIRTRAAIERVANDARVHPQVAQDWLLDGKLPNSNRESI